MRTVAEREVEERTVAVACLDLDGFKAVNDSLGRAAQRLSEVLRMSDTLARLGGDEFAVLVEHGADRGGITTVASTLVAALVPPFELNGRTVSVSASVGVASVEPGRGRAQASSLLHRADVAMYAVKSAGKGGYAVHSAPMVRAGAATALPGTRDSAATQTADAGPRLRAGAGGCGWR